MSRKRITKEELDKLIELERNLEEEVRVLEEDKIQKEYDRRIKNVTELTKRKNTLKAALLEEKKVENKDEEVKEKKIRKVMHIRDKKKIEVVEVLDRKVEEVKKVEVKPEKRRYQIISDNKNEKEVKFYETNEKVKTNQSEAEQDLMNLAIKINELIQPEILANTYSHTLVLVVRGDKVEYRTVASLQKHDGVITVGDIYTDLSNIQFTAVGNGSDIDFVPNGTLLLDSAEIILRPIQKTIRLQVGNKRTKLEHFNKDDLEKVKYSKDDCLLNCVLASFHKTDKTAQSLRKELDLEEGEITLSVKLLNNIQQITKRHIEIIKDSKKNEIILESDRSNRTIKDITLIYKDNHLFLKKSVPKPSRLLIVDFETINDGIKLVDYAVGFIELEYPTVDKKLKINKEDVKIIFKANGISPVNELISFIKNSEYNYEIITFNGSKFDNFLIFNAACNKNYVTEAFMANNEIKSFKMYGHKTFDLCKIVNTSLKSACENFKTEFKKQDGFDHSIPQGHFNDGKFYEFLNDEKDKLTEYLTYDVLSTASLTEIVYKSMKKFDIDIFKTKSSTIAGLAYEKLTKIVNDSDYTMPICSINKTTDEFFRESIYGGRAQCFTTKTKHDEKLVQVDITSSYPTVKAGINAELLPKQTLYGYYPIGDEIPTNEYKEGYIGYYNCTINRQPKLKIIPFRDKDDMKPLDWKYKEQFDAVLNQCDIEAIKYNGGEVIVKNGYYYEKKCNRVFKEYVDFFITEKNKQDVYKKNKDDKYNNSIREICKLFLNSASGKFCQKNYEETSSLVRGHNNLKERVDKLFKGGLAEYHQFGYKSFILIGKKKDNYNVDGKTVSSRPKPSQVSSLIYSYARLYLYEILLKDNEAIYTDTDSCVMTIANYKKFVEKYPTLNDGVKKLGSLDEELGEYHHCRSSFLAAKMYCIITYDKDDKILKSKVRMKGVNMNRDKLVLKYDEKYSLKENDKNEITFKQREQAFSYGDRTIVNEIIDLSIDPMRLYIELSKIRKNKNTEEKVIIMCSQLKRIMMDKTVKYTTSNNTDVKELVTPETIINDVKVIKDGFKLAQRYIFKLIN